MVLGLHMLCEGQQACITALWSGRVGGRGRESWSPGDCMCLVEGVGCGAGGVALRAAPFFVLFSQDRCTLVSFPDCGWGGGLARRQPRLLLLLLLLR